MIYVVRSNTGQFYRRGRLVRSRQAASFGHSPSGAAGILERARKAFPSLEWKAVPFREAADAPHSLADVLPFAELLDRAAFVIRTHADELRLSHTVRGRWPAGEEAVRDEFHELAALADRLSKAAAYHRPNPLGGPAVVFDACADAIRAGDPINSAMRDYGLAWRAPSRKEP